MRAIQMRAVSGLDYHGESRPAAAGPKAGGDFFDLVPLEGEGLAVSLGEMSGFGAGTSVLMSGLRASLRGFAENGRGKISATVQALNQTIWELTPGDLYGRLFYARLDAATCELTYVSAGHEPVLLVRRHPARVRRLETTGAVLGLARHSEYRQLAISLEPGDLLVAFSGGISDATNAAGREWSEGGVLQVVNQTPDARAADLARDILTEADRFTGHAVPADDRTVVVVRFQGRGQETAFEASAAERAFAAA
ncbi:MAG TPA: SpoIIE family protein phosphatase [Bryobacteraceae bacterium]|nr:SpoIIE family protein phosphatase [Bryobacteraceae bacterium]